MNSSRGERLQRHAMDLVGQGVWDSDMLERQALNSFCPKIRNDGGSLPLQLLPYLYPGTGVPFRFDGEGVALREQALCPASQSNGTGTGYRSLNPDKAAGE
jgi:hypothetical protein